MDYLLEYGNKSSDLFVKMMDNRFSRLSTNKLVRALRDE